MNIIGQSTTITLVIDMNKNFSCENHIRTLRLERGLSQEKLALGAGITPAYLGLIEHEKRNVTIAVTERICAAMSVSLTEFFSPANTAPSPAEDDIGMQILHQLHGLSIEEKHAFVFSHRNKKVDRLYLFKIAVYGLP